MKILVGLGNPGPEYAQNRHNVGFMFLDHFSGFVGSAEDASEQKNFRPDKKLSADVCETSLYDDKLLLLKPQTFMNDSGRAVSLAKAFYKVENKDIIVVHDDLDITLGEYKIHFGKGPQIHNGLISVNNTIGEDYMRVRIGIDSRDGDRDLSGKAYVLQNFTSSEINLLRNDVFPSIAERMQSSIFISL